MLLHTVLSRRAEHIIGDMEEKAVQLTNILQLRRDGGHNTDGGRPHPGTRAMTAMGGA
jgi:biopolymer transport protein ExbB